MNIHGNETKRKKKNIAVRALFTSEFIRLRILRQPEYGKMPMNGKMAG